MVDETKLGASPTKTAASMLPLDPVPLGTADVELTADVAIAAQQVPEEEREAYQREIERILKNRKTPFGTLTQKLALPQRPGYKRHWFNDSPGRVDEAEANGWAKVKDKVAKHVRRVVGTGRDGGPLYAYAMEVPKPIWDMEQEARHQAAQARMDDIKKNPVRAPAGVAQSSDRDKFYSPHQEALSVKETLVIRKREGG